MSGKGSIEAHMWQGFSNIDSFSYDPCGSLGLKAYTYFPLKMPVTGAGVGGSPLHACIF